MQVGRVMPVLFFDTETSDLPDMKAGPGPRQPHVVQLAAILVIEHTERVLNVLIKPDGWRIHRDALALHGITVERASAEGVPIAEAIAGFEELLSQADLAVAHNMKFDQLMVDSERLRLGRHSTWPETFCTMMACTGILQIPGRGGGYKWPTLGESYSHFLRKPLVGSHDALADVRACMAVYEELRCRGAAPKG